MRKNIKFFIVTSMCIVRSSSSCAQRKALSWPPLRVLHHLANDERRVGRRERGKNKSTRKNNQFITWISESRDREYEKKQIFEGECKKRTVHWVSRSRVEILCVKKSGRIQKLYALLEPPFSKPSDLLSVCHYPNLFCERLPLFCPLEAQTSRTKMLNT